MRHPREGALLGDAVIGADQRGAIGFAEKVLELLDEGRYTATYKYALLLALMLKLGASWMQHEVCDAGHGTNHDSSFPREAQDVAPLVRTPPPRERRSCGRVLGLYVENRVLRVLTTR